MKDKEKAYVKDLTDKDYKEAVSKGIVFIDFWAPWCGPCLKLAPHVKALAKELEGQVSFYKVNTDNHKANYSTHGFRGIPALVIYKDGKVVSKFVGYMSKEKLMAKIKPHLESKYKADFDSGNNTQKNEKKYVKDLTDADYQKAVSKGIVFIDFWAPWCGPCLKLAPHVKALAKELEGKVSFYKVNVDNHKANYSTHKFQGIPCACHL